MEWGILGLTALIIGIAAGIVQVLDYLEKRRRKPEEPPLPPPPQPKIPHNLPQPGEFIGRQREKADVREALASRSYLVCIDGIGGIGKTALALEVMYECLKASRDEIPADGIPTFDAFVWTTAKDRELALSDILDTIARTLDYPYIAQLPLEEKPSEAAKLLRAQRCLLIVDNFETITDDAVRDFLLNLPDPSKVLITSREQKLRQARAISLRGMEQGEALALIRSEGKRLGLLTVENAEEKVLLRLYEATGGAPLAIKWAVGQMKQRGQSLDTVLDYLYGARGDIFEKIFARSWGLLSENARRVLMVMPIFATSASKPAIEAASDVHKWDLDEALGQLVEMWLVGASEELDEAKRRYNIHPLTRAFAGAKLRQEAIFGRTARLRSTDYFLALARDHIGEGWYDLAALETEKDNLFSLVEWCYNSEHWEPTNELVKTLGWFLDRRGYWLEHIRFGRMAIEASKRLNDRHALAQHLIFALGWTYYRMGKHSEAKEYVQQGKQVAEENGDQFCIALAMRNLGVLARRQNLERAKHLILESLQIWEELGNRIWIARTKGSLGSTALRLGDYEEAQRQWQDALATNQEIGNLDGVADSLRRLAHIANECGNLPKAQKLYKEALKIKDALGARSGMASNYLSLALVEEQLGNFADALSCARKALEINERLERTYRTEEIRALVERLEKEVTGQRMEGPIAEAQK